MSSIFGSTLGRIILGIIAVVVLIVAWILISPLFINKTVDESLSQVADARTAEAEVLARGMFEDADAAHIMTKHSV